MKDIPAILSKPVVKGKEVFIAPNATVIGNVSLGDNSSVWFGAVIRGDINRITIGNRTNIQDNAVVHVDEEDPVTIGDDCVIGHLALVHGAKIGNKVLVGMNSTILNNVEIGDGSVIGANALVTANTIIPPNSLVLGSPAKVIKTIGEERIQATVDNAWRYVKLAGNYMNFMDKNNV